MLPSGPGDSRAEFGPSREPAVYIVSKCVRKRGGKNSANIGSVEEIADILRFPKWYDT